KGAPGLGQKARGAAPWVQSRGRAAAVASHASDGPSRYRASDFADRAPASVLGVRRFLPPELPPNALAQCEMGQHNREPRLPKKRMKSPQLIRADTARNTQTRLYSPPPLPLGTLPHLGKSIA